MYRYMDLNRMEAKCDDRKYKYLDQFYTDCRTILHNVYISYGGQYYILFIFLTLRTLMSTSVNNLCFY